jgi:hypothetical protein
MEVAFGGACGAYGEARNAYKTFVGKPKGKRQLGRAGRRWEDNIKTANIFQKGFYGRELDLPG